MVDPERFKRQSPVTTGDSPAVKCKRLQSGYRKKKNETATRPMQKQGYITEELLKGGVNSVF